jgi:GGDEF domain-containing protein
VSLSPAALPFSPPLAALARDSLVVSPDEPASRLEKRFRHQPGLPVAVIVSAGRPIGIIERNYLFELFAQPYGRALCERKHVAGIMQTAMVLDGGTPLLEAGRHLIESGDENDELPHSLVVVQGDNQYVGLVRVRELLRCLTELQVQLAREANPLTGLPGNQTLARHIEACLAARTPVHVAYFDCNHFKPYNDIYGYAAGDNVIQTIGRLLQEQAGANDLVAHIGGDDFMVVFGSDDWQARCEAVLREFRAQLPHFYSREDLGQGRFRARDRQGKVVWFPLLGLAIGACCPDPAFCGNHLDVSALAADAKKEAKRIGGSVLYLTRRRRPSPWQEAAEDAVG